MFLCMYLSHEFLLMCVSVLGPCTCVVCVSESGRDSACVCVCVPQIYHSEGLDRPRLVLTIHNLDNTGECRQDEFYYAGLPGEPFATVRGR